MVRHPGIRSNWRLTDRRGRIWLDLNPVVFISATALIAAFVLLGLLFLEDFSQTVKILQAWIANQTGWFLILTVNIILGYLVYLLFSPYGGIRLGGPEARPDFSLAAWFAMLFSAGMGIGLMFYSVAEPIYHLLAPPHGAEPGSIASYEDAISTTFLHWGLHAWGIYTLTGLAIAYFAFNHEQPLSIRGVFRPLLGDRVDGFCGHVIDTVAAVATLLGVATSLGLGATQINAGLNHLYNIPANATVQLLLIAGITAIATISVVLGLKRGIKRLSVFNMLLAALLLLYVISVGPSLFIFNGFVENIGLYLDDFFYLAFWNETYSRGDWQNGWTVFYWGWWIAWSPFVGMFIARVSRGRSIREFIGGVLFMATTLTFIWLSVFGDSALYVELLWPGSLSGAVEKDIAGALFVFLDKLPAAGGLGGMSSIVTLVVGTIATMVIVSFFVTSSDSGSLVIDIITAGGHPNPPVLQRIFWAVSEGVVAAILLVGGGLTALQTAAISAGLPFSLLLLFMILNLNRVLSADSAPVVVHHPPMDPDL